MSSSLVARTVLRAAIPRRLAPLARTPFSSPSPVIRSTFRRHQQTAAMSANAFLDLVKARRTHYALGKDLPVSKERVQEIVNTAVNHVPSSFNCQPNRVAVLFGAEHDKFWDIVAETLKAIVPAAGWPASEARVNGFKAGAGSILFFEDQTTTEAMQAKFALYADKFPGWTTQSDGMLQYTLWLALEAEGVGANLQHYNPIVDDKVAAAWGLPASWKLNAQLVFGKKTGEAGEKTFKPLEERVKVFGA
ncbi:hypothetical protein RB597_010372 [Gaeumannomyces tritici]